VERLVIRVALLVAGKDLRIERRSRVLLWQVVPFGVTALLLCGLALGPTQAGHSSAAPGLFYLVMLLVALLMINRSPGHRGLARHPGVGGDPRTRSRGVFLGKALALAVELWLTAVVVLADRSLFCIRRSRGRSVAVPSVVGDPGGPRGRGHALRRPEWRRAGTRRRYCPCSRCPPSRRC
jgi:hypothetical protein